MLIRSIIAYLVAGNNLEKLDVKRMDEDHGRKIKTMLRDIGVSNKGSRLNSTETLTLSRIAMTYSPVVFLMRLYFNDKIQLRSSLDLDIIYQDIALINVSRLLRFPSKYDDFLEWFGQQINPDSKNQQMFTDLARNNSNVDSYYEEACELIMSSGLDFNEPDLSLIDELINSILLL